MSPAADTPTPVAEATDREQLLALLLALGELYERLAHLVVLAYDPDAAREEA